MESNDPVNPKATLHVSAVIEVLFGFESSILDVGRLRMGETATETAFLILKDQDKRNLLAFNSSSPYVTVETVNPAEPDKNRIEVQIMVSPEAAAGRLNETITAKLTDNSRPASKLSIRGSIVGNIEIAPETMQLTADTSQSAVNQIERSVRVVSTRSDFEFKLKSVSDPNGYLSLAVDTVTAGERYIIRAGPNKKALGMGHNLAGEVKVVTSDVEQPELTFRYNIIFPRR